MAEKDPSGWFGGHMPKKPEIGIPSKRDSVHHGGRDISFFDLFLLIFVLLAAIVFFSFSFFFGYLF